MNPESRAPTFASVQILRGVAALMVVLNHASRFIQFGGFGPLHEIGWGAAGVDIFFPISGFVMTLMLQPGVHGLQAGKAFALKRLIRIVPLYWLFTVLKLLLELRAPAAGITAVPETPWHVIASFLFIPAAAPGGGDIRPVLQVGWTLSFEMLFYLLFTVGICVSRRPLPYIFGSLALGTAVSLVRTSIWPAPFVLLDPLLLEFALGIGVALAIKRRITVNRWTALLLIVASCALFPALNGTGPWRLLFWGLPGAAMLYAFTSLEPHFRAAGFDLPRRIGDASYAIYLSHTAVLMAIHIVSMKARLHGLVAGSAILILSLVASCCVGLAVHVYVEKPLLRWLGKHLVRTPRREVIVAGARGATQP